MSSSTILAVVVENPLDVHTASPFVVAILGAVFFAFLGCKAGESWLPWAGGGALLGLLTTATFVGFANSLTIPYTSGDETKFRLLSIAAALAVIALVGFLSLLSLRRRPSK